MRTWKEVAQILVDRVNEYEGQRGRNMSRVRIGYKVLYAVREQSRYVPLTDADWDEMRREFAAHDVAVIQAEPQSIGLMRLDRAHTWTKIGVPGLDEEQDTE